jgi:hypothetical protein
MPGLSAEFNEILGSIITRNISVSYHVVRTLKVRGISVFSLVTGFHGARPLSTERRQAGRQAVVNYSNRREFTSGQFACIYIGHARLT